MFQCFVTAEALLLCVRVKGKADALCTARKIDLQMNWVVSVRVVQANYILNNLF